MNDTLLFIWLSHFFSFIRFLRCVPIALLHFAIPDFWFSVEHSAMSIVVHGYCLLKCFPLFHVGSVGRLLTATRIFLIPIESHEQPRPFHHIFANIEHWISIPYSCEPLIVIDVTIIFIIITMQTWDECAVFLCNSLLVTISIFIFVFLFMWNSITFVWGWTMHTVHALNRRNQL